ncbi:LamG domain-containing protein [Sphingomonas sp. dw_22]|uniref:LamG domain-containing protein n=1 Tax=Sphingomonas sp. dw_22 TaxID=2721175 RepID=UPI002115EF9C|nr:LamG domain-containing protein [Sphingomonas sp. dw_22]
MMVRSTTRFLAGTALALCVACPATAQTGDGLLFRASGDKDATAERASGDAVPNFQSKVTRVADGAIGGAFRWADDGYVAWNAPGNIQAQRGTLSFFWRSRERVGEAPFAIFRVGFADHSSWDMAFLRIDWNGHGFDAFVTDTNLSRERVSFRLPESPAPEAWHHIAFSWDETVGVRLYVDGKEAARLDQKADLDSGLDQFGLAGRIIAPHQVQSRYSFMRGSDVDEIRVYDRMLDAAGIAALAAKSDPAAQPVPGAAAKRAAWLHRFGWDRASPPVLDSAETSIRKVEFSDAKDLKEWMWKGIDGIAETTWPGVYNRSKLPGRDDYFELPDWNVYVEGGKTYTLAVPAGEHFNRVEIRGAAYGALDYAADGGSFRNVAKRPQGVVRSFDSLPGGTGGVLRFTNTMQEQPIQEIWAYDVKAGKEPEGSFKLSYAIDSKDGADFAALDKLNRFIAGRYAPDERATVVALPSVAGHAAPGAGNAADASAASHVEGAQPIVHVLIPSGFGDAYPGRPLARAWNYGWEDVHDGLDGIALDIPALKATPGADGLIPLNIRVKDPIWPGRDMVDVSVSVRPGEARTLWLDLRDRILTNDSLYLTIASAAPDFGPKSLDGTQVRLVFKDRAAALPEHIADRFNQVKDNWAFLVEEHTASKRAALYRRVFGDITDLLRADPDNVEGRRYWADISYGAYKLPAFKQPEAPAGVPLWAFRQLEDLKLTREFVNWWIDNRQVPYGDFGGGISDDVDLTEQWPGLALMGVDLDKINASLRALSDSVYTNGMRVNGLGYITTDELHAYEEGLNSDAERLYLNWGEPKAIERLMATAKALQGVILKNPAGHMHFATNWYGGRKMYREGPWEWQKPYSFTVMHAPILIGLYNGNQQAEGLVTSVVDGWMTHGKQDAKGNWTYPNEINWRTDAERVGDGGGLYTSLQSAWAAWRFTGDAKYLQPMLSRTAKNGPASVQDLNENVVALLGQDKDWAKTLAAKGKGASPFEQWAAWDATSDTAHLESLHADAIAEKAQHQYMYTLGHWWSDRVEQPNDILQRERLGGIALSRNQTWPGNTVSWRFDDPEGATQTAILMPGATPTHFKVIAYNTGDRPQSAEMTSWNVDPGQWEMKTGGTTTQVPLERSASTRVAFAPHATTEIEFTLRTPSSTVSARPDLGIGTDDVAVQGRNVSVTVHNLGAQDTSGGTITIEDANGKALATAKVPAIAAPLDLTPKTAVVKLALPKGAARIHVALEGGAPEVTRRNNVVALPTAK